MKKYAKLIAGAISGTACAVMSYYAWPIFTQPEFEKIAWMAGSMIALIGIGFYMLLSDILKELL